VKSSFRIQLSAQGATFCGYRILPGAIRLTPLKRRRYAERRRAWEWDYRSGIIDALQLQRAYAAVHAITAHADAAAWRREHLRRQGG
jgi:RNA-directed DNA polymerase